MAGVERVFCFHRKGESVDSRAWKGMAIKIVTCSS